MKTVACLVASLSMFMSLAVAQAPAGKADESLSYDKAVAKVWGHIISTPYVVDWCSKNVRSSKGPVQKAYKEWSARFAPLISDINQRIDKVMNPGGQVPAREFEQRKADLMKRGAQRFANSMAEQPADVVQRECSTLPERFETDDFNLEALFAAELRTIRAHPAN